MFRSAKVGRIYLSEGGSQLVDKLAIHKPIKRHSRTAYRIDHAHRLEC